MLFEHAIALARASSCSKRKFTSCSPASLVSPKPYSPTADNIAGGSLKEHFPFHALNKFGFFGYPALAILQSQLVEPEIESTTSQCIYE